MKAFHANEATFNTLRVMYGVKRSRRALCSSFVSSSIVSGRIIVFLCYILYDVTDDRFKPKMSLSYINLHFIHVFSVSRSD